MMVKTPERGFTLIELLVVISIIGLLSSVVLSSLQTARLKSRDTAIKAQVRQFVTLMNLNFNETGSYAQLQSGWDYTAADCSGSFSGAHMAKARELCTAIVEDNGGAGLHTGNNVSTATRFSVMAQLASQALWVCAGSSGGYTDTQVTGGWTGTGCFANP